jgi:hypothetical protein
MNAVAEALLAVAATLPPTLAICNRSTFDDASKIPLRSEFICDALEDCGNGVYSNDVPSEAQTRAKKFLHSLGMGHGLREFGDSHNEHADAYQERYELRVTWLEFAAHIAEEWGVE